MREVVWIEEGREVKSIRFAVSGQKWDFDEKRAVWVSNDGQVITQEDLKELPTVTRTAMENLLRGGNGKAL